MCVADVSFLPGFVYCVGRCGECSVRFIVAETNFLGSAVQEIFMRSKRRISVWPVVATAVLLTTLLTFGCSAKKQALPEPGLLGQAENLGGVEPSAVAKLQIGMTIKQAMDAMQPAMPAIQM